MTGCSNPKAALKRAEDCLVSGDATRFFNILALEFTPDTQFSSLVAAMRFCGRIKFPAMTTLSLAVLGGGTLDLLCDMTRFWMTLERIDLRVYLPPYGVWRQEVLSPQSTLYQTNPEFIWFFTNRRDIEELGRMSPQEAVNNLRTLWDVIRERLPGIGIVQNNCDLPAERVFGNFEATCGCVSWCVEYNQLLTEACRENNILLFDYAYEAAYCGLSAWDDPRYWFHSKNTFAPEVTPRISYDAAKFLAALKGKAKKCVVLDLDNTLWGGVIGDDGIDGILLGSDFGPSGEAFCRFQEYLKELSRRGILLTICSKNDEETAKEPFLCHPGMRLKIEDIAVFKANWNNKADNIRDIASTLNLGLDSFVFLDDNPAERELVRNELPAVSTPEWPSDPAFFGRFLDSRRYFETASLSSEDLERTRMYHEGTRRVEYQKQSSDMTAYLSSLKMNAKVMMPTAYTLPRMAQLVNKSNQFHPTTTRYSEAELARMSESDEYIVRAFSLSDRFGDYGLIAVLVLKKVDREAYIVDTWAMSCRVLERGMEQFICRELKKIALDKGARYLIGKYIPTAKNSIVSSLFETLGFVRKGDAVGEELYRLDLKNAGPEWACFITPA